MPYERTPFGTGGAAGSGNVVRTVNNHFGPRDSGKTSGVVKTEGTVNEMTLQIDAAMVTAGVFPLVVPRLPRGSRILDVTAWTEEAFNLGGTTPTIRIGTVGSVATNNITISETQAETLGVAVVTTFNGTFANPLAADTDLALGLGGTSPTNGTVGRMRVTIRYVDNRL